MHQFSPRYGTQYGVQISQSMFYLPYYILRRTVRFITSKMIKFYKNNSNNIELPVNEREVFTDTAVVNGKGYWYKMLSYRRETALQPAGCVIVLAKTGRLELGDNILRTLYCDIIIVLKIYRIRWNNAKYRFGRFAVYYGVQGHQGRYQSKARMLRPVSDHRQRSRAALL